jgi:hypothetical protein
MGRTGVVVAVVASGALIAGCAGPSELLGSSSKMGSTSTGTASTASTGTYLQALRSEQAMLAAAERAIPANTRTPAALSRSISLLARAIGRLADGLAGLRPPRAAAAENVKLISIVRAYRSRLTGAAVEAKKPGGELLAGRILLAATNVASREFSATAMEINRALR